jgi:catalase (peroxidase I)
MAVLAANYRGSRKGVFTMQSETLANDFFATLVDTATEQASISVDIAHTGYPYKRFAPRKIL